LLADILSYGAWAASFVYPFPRTSREAGAEPKPNQEAADSETAARYSKGHLGFKEPAQSTTLPQ
jgi:hypothetical protein